MSEMILCRGLPASGKSTWAKEKLVKLRGEGVFAARVCRDDIRMVCFSDTFPGYEAEKAVTEMRDAMIKAVLSEGGTVIVDETLIRPKYIKHLVAIANDYGAKKVLQDFTDVSPETCMDRNNGRKGEVPVEVIIKMAQTLKMNRNVDDLLADDGSTTAEFPTVTQDKSLPHTVIVDIDGTLAHMKNRSPYDFTKVGEDFLDETVAELVSLVGMNEAGYKQIIFLSGRDDSCEIETRRWLVKHGLVRQASDAILFMRKTGDDRKDSIVKHEIFMREILPNYYVEFVLDDRNQVVKMWREIGLKCLQVADGDF